MSNAPTTNAPTTTDTDNSYVFRVHGVDHLIYANSCAEAMAAANRSLLVDDDASNFHAWMGDDATRRYVATYGAWD
jgi:hypothetical protein